MSNTGESTRGSIWTKSITKSSSLIDDLLSTLAEFYFASPDF